MSRIFLAAALAATALVPAAHAQNATPVKKPDLGYVKDKPAIALDPDTSYMIVRSRAGAASFAFIRMAEEADIADYRARRAVALDKAHRKWVRRHETWARNMAAYKKDPVLRNPGPEPVEPTDANLSFTPIDVENMISFGPLNRFAKGDTAVYVYGVRPGRYAFYGPIMTLPNGAAAGTCMCMGTFEFEVKPGQIVDVGTLVLNLPIEREKAKAAGAPAPKTALDLPAALTSTSWEAPAAGAKIDPRLASYTVVPADLRASRRVPNYLGLEIDRLTPVEGVLAYRRDRIVDVKSGQELP